LVGLDAVHLFLHPGIPRANAGLDVSERDVQGGRRERTGEDGVGVAQNHAPFGRTTRDDGLHTGSHRRYLLSAGSRSDPQMYAGLTDAGFLEEAPGHLRAVAPPGVHDDLLVPGLGERAGKWVVLTN
jgi:hypothetical protein